MYYIIYIYIHIRLITRMRSVRRKSYTHNLNRPCVRVRARTPVFGSKRTRIIHNMCIHSSSFLVVVLMSYYHCCRARLKFSFSRVIAATLLSLAARVSVVRRFSTAFLNVYLTTYEKTPVSSLCAAANTNSAAARITRETVLHSGPTRGYWGEFVIWSCL